MYIRNVKYMIDICCMVFSSVLFVCVYIHIHICTVCIYYAITITHFELRSLSIPGSQECCIGFSKDCGAKKRQDGHQIFDHACSSENIIAVSLWENTWAGEKKTFFR